MACSTCGHATRAGTGKPEAVPAWGVCTPGYCTRHCGCLAGGASVPDSIAWSCVGAQSKH